MTACKDGCRCQCGDTCECGGECFRVPQEWWTPTEATFTLPCDACGEQTPDPQGCHHGRDLCPTCSDEDACKDCRRERRDDA